MAERESLELTPREKLRLMKSPLIEDASERRGSEPNLSEFGDRFSDPSIQFQRVSFQQQANLEMRFDSDDGFRGVA
jgi:hypothetical protein